MREVWLVPHGWPCTLAECPPGHFEFEGIFGFKTEYGRGENLRWPEAFNEGGEAFWGGVKTNEECARLMVQPCAVQVVETEEGHYYKVVDRDAAPEASGPVNDE